MSWLRPTSLIFAVVLSLPPSLYPHDKADALYVVDDYQCVDVTLVFNRGSGQNGMHKHLGNKFTDAFQGAEKESYAFFKNHADHFINYYPGISYKAVSVHDFPGKYDSVGYKAVPVGWQNVARISNSANSDASWFPGDYQSSVQHGVAETVGYIKDQVASCPDQYLMVGGYSQGAQVIGEALFQLTDQERQQILGVGLFGDPKYIASTDGLPIKLDPTVSFPWRRGEARDKDTGMLEPRFPYVPGGMERRTLSWCSKNDIVCAGWSALRSSSSHSSYSANPIRHVVEELVAISGPQLVALNKSEDGTPVPAVEISKQDQERLRDVMFVMNDNSNSDVLQTFRYYLDPMMTRFNMGFTGTRYAAKSFGEHDYGFSAPRVDNIQSFLPYIGFDLSNPTFTASNLQKSFAAKYQFGKPVIGGGDLADPHQLALEKSIVSTGWRDDPNVERNLILITDRPPKDPYEYNICNSTVRAWLHFPETDGYKNCYTDYRREIWQKVLVPETCETIRMVITQDTCTSPLAAPNYIHMNKRTLEDEIKLAQAYNVKVSVVIPHKFDPIIHYGNKLSNKTERDKLKRIADATGGAYIYYDSNAAYNTTLLNNTLFNVFTKKPKSIDLVVDGKNDQQVMGISTDTSTVLDASRQAVIADTYKWDFNDDGQWDHVSQGPVIERRFNNPGAGIMLVQAQLENGAVVSESRQAYVVSHGVQEEIPESPSITGLRAEEQPDGTVAVSWEPRPGNQIVVIDSESKLPIASAPSADGHLTLPTSYDNLEIIVVGEDVASEPIQVTVVQYVAPAAPVIEIEPAKSEPNSYQVANEPDAPAIQGMLNTPDAGTPIVIKPLATTTSTTTPVTTVSVITNETGPAERASPAVAAATVVSNNEAPNLAKTTQPVQTKNQQPWWLLAVIVVVMALVGTRLKYRHSTSS